MPNTTKERPSSEDIETAGKYLHEAWKKYKANFGESPHGTEIQMAALLELARPEEWVKSGLAQKG